MKILNQIISKKRKAAIIALIMLFIVLIASVIHLYSKPVSEEIAWISYFIDTYKSINLVQSNDGDKGKAKLKFFVDLYKYSNSERSNEEDEEEIKRIHQNKATMEMDLCVVCHSNKRWFIRNMHESKAKEHAMTYEECATCHKEMFCYKCHKMPSYHKPLKDPWVFREKHGSLYKNDPEECKSCHKVSFCNDRCHAAHSPGYAEDTQCKISIINEKGLGFCSTTCHYPTYCFKCHKSKANRYYRKIKFAMKQRIK